MKICILSNDHQTCDVRLYYKIGKSLAKIGEVHLICASGVCNSLINPYQDVAEADSKWGTLLQLYKKAKKIHPGIVICVEPLTLLVGLALKKKIKCKVIFDIHEFYADYFAEKFPYPFKWLMKTIYLSLERRLQRKVDGTIAVNEQILHQLGVEPKKGKVAIIPNYPVKNVWDYTCEIPMELSTICAMNFDLIYIGGLSADRGIFKILKSINILRDEFPQLKALIVGNFRSAAIENKFNTMLTDYNLTAFIYYQNWIPPEKIGLLLKRSKIGLWVFNPQNKSLYLSIPLKVMEYFAAGLPVVSTKTPLMYNLIEKNQLGYCCEYHSASIADAISRILRLDEEKYQTMSKHCIALIENKYNWESLEPELLDLIQHLAVK
jgi:glycosyltransferase involved in cell wall biosynthesis